MARIREGARVTVEGVLTTGTGLLDASGRRAIIQDGSAAIELYLDAPDGRLRPGMVARVTGTVGRAWGAPRLRVEALRVVGERVPGVLRLRAAPGAATEWRLVRISGTVLDVRRDGDRWRAEVGSGSLRLLVSGLPGSGLPSTALVEGRTAVVTGIARRPHPSATDRRFSVVPRGAADVRLGAPAAAGAPGASPGTAGPGSDPRGGPAGPAGQAGAVGALDGGGDAAPVPDIDLRDLGSHVGTAVRVGGLVTAVDEQGLRIDDGTATARVLCTGEAAALLGLVQPGDAVNATGTPELREDLVLVVDDPAGLVLLGDLGEPDEPAGGAGDGGAWPPGVEDPEPGGPAERGHPSAALAGLGGTGGLQPDGAGLAVLVLATFAGMGAGLAGRLRARRRLRARIAARLETFAGRGAARRPVPRHAGEPAAGPPERPPFRDTFGEHA